MSLRLQLERKNIILYFFFPLIFPSFTIYRTTFYFLSKKKTGGKKKANFTAKI